MPPSGSFGYIYFFFVSLSARAVVSQHIHMQLSSSTRMFIYFVGVDVFGNISTRLDHILAAVIRGSHNNNWLLFSFSFQLTLPRRLLISFLPSFLLLVEYWSIFRKGLDILNDTGGVMKKASIESSLQLTFQRVYQFTTVFNRKVHRHLTLKSLRMKGICISWCVLSRWIYSTCFSAGSWSYIEASNISRIPTQI